MAKQTKPVSPEVVPKKKRTRCNRTAGHNYERECAIELREIGFPHVVTSREESVARDAQKIDLMNRNEAKNGRLPYNIQCKNSEQLIRYQELLVSGKVKYRNAAGKKVSVHVKAMPKIEGIVNVIFHKYTVKSESGKFMPKGEFAILEKADFLEMVQELEQYRNNKDVLE